MAAGGSPSAAERAGRAARSAAPKLVSGTLNGSGTRAPAENDEGQGHERCS